MKRFTLVLLFILCVLGLTSISFAEDATLQPHCNFTWTFYSKYIWRGLDLRKASPFLFPSIAGRGHQGLNLNDFKDIDIGFNGRPSGGGEKERWQNDGILTYQDSLFLRDKTALNMTVGVVGYDTHAGENKEVFANLGLNTFIVPEISFWKGLEFKDSWAINFGLSHNLDLSKCWSKADGWTLGLGSGVSYYGQENANDNDWHDANVWADLNIPFKDGVSINPSINYSFPVKDPGKESLEDGSFNGFDSNFVFGGVTLKIPF